MNTNRAIVIGLFIFWAIVVAILVAGFVSAENEKMIDALSKNNNQQREGAMREGGDGVYVGDVSLGETVEPVYLDEPYIASHNALDDCWIIISGDVYDVSEYIPLHPGGVDEIRDSCGVDGTEGFQTKNQKDPENHSDFAHELLESYYLGSVGDVIANRIVIKKDFQESVSSVDGQNNTDTGQGDTKQDDNLMLQNKETVTVIDSSPGTKPALKQTPVSSTSGLTPNVVAQHSLQGDCWIIMDGNVYDFTAYVPLHPGGIGAIVPYCGGDGTQAFNNEGHSNYARNIWSNYILGAFVTETIPPAPDAPMCNDFTYTTWGACQPDGSQTRVVTSSIPAGCTGGTPVTSQSCTYTPSESNTGYPAIDAEFSGATVLETENSDGITKVKIWYEDIKYEVKLDESGDIISYKVD